MRLPNLARLERRELTHLTSYLRLVFVGGLLTLSLPTFAAETILQADFETDPIRSDWTSFGRGKFGTDLLWSNETPYSGTHCLTVQPSRKSHGAGWESPPFKVSEGQLYRLTFWARTAVPAFWQITFQDSTGAQTEGDHNSAITASNDWAFHEQFFRTKFPGKIATAAFYVLSDAPLSIDEVRVEPTTTTEALTAADQRWLEMFGPSPSPSPAAPKASGKLLSKQGNPEPFRIVLLGDSIANDLSNSSLPLLLERAFPGSKVDCRFTGRGGTSWMKLQLQFDQRIQQHHPDLLVLQAISNDEEWMVAPLERLIDECRKKSPQTEIILVTPHLKRWNPQREDGVLQRERILEVAKAKQVDVFDLQTIWTNYLESTGRPPETLLRDPLHMSESGRELSARAFVEYLATRR